jgi:hypothetical protein
MESGEYGATGVLSGRGDASAGGTGAGLYCPTFVLMGARLLSCLECWRGSTRGDTGEKDCACVDAWGEIGDIGVLSFIFGGAEMYACCG